MFSPEQKLCPWEALQGGGNKLILSDCLITDFNKEIAVLMWSSSLGKKKKFYLAFVGWNPKHVALSMTAFGSKSMGLNL